MIVPIPNESYRDHYVDGYVLLLNSIPHFDTFLESAGVEGSGYAATITDRIYRQLFELSIDLKGEFEMYYKPEYDSFNEYLYRNFELPDEFIQQADDVYDQYEYLRLAYPYANFLHGDDGENRLRLLLGEE
ncbi:MAG: hypothetical protein HONBIEJF_02557 [Fimbriimonadaceae bacterium]|nr:hypothetical protein [Fimbriimonadaceae bacterium]